MPTKTLLRFWCSECKEYTLHDTTHDKSCTICGTITNTYKLSDVPEEKLMEQRERYTQMKKNQFSKMMNVFSNVCIRSILTGLGEFGRNH